MGMAWKQSRGTSAGDACTPISYPLQRLGSYEQSRLAADFPALIETLDPTRCDRSMPKRGCCMLRGGVGLLLWRLRRPQRRPIRPLGSGQDHNRGSHLLQVFVGAIPITCAFTWSTTTCRCTGRLRSARGPSPTTSSSCRRRPPPVTSIASSAIFRSLREFVLNASDYTTHAEVARAFRRYLHRRDTDHHTSRIRGTSRALGVILPSVGGVTQCGQARS
jgi:hypothetical protein